MSPIELANAKAARIADRGERLAAEVAITNVANALRDQCGVVSVGQLHAAGLGRGDIVRLLRRGALRRIHPRVYVDHTGPLTREQRLWAALLFAEPAVVCGPTLLDLDAEGDLHIAVDATRRLTRLDGVRIHRVRNLGAFAQWKTSPPRMRREDNVLAMVDEAATELDVVRLLTDASRDRAIGTERLREAMSRRSRLRRRAFVSAVLDDIASGAQSVFEWGYLDRVERAHGLPCPSRQVTRRTAGGKQYRDIEYGVWQVVIELDGRLNHDSWEAENRDADRDLADAADGKVTIRLRWRQVFGTACATALQLETVLRQRGWPGRAKACGPGCPLGRVSVESESRLE